MLQGRFVVGIYFIGTLLKFTISSVDTELEWMFWRGTYIQGSFPTTNINKVWAGILSDRWPAPCHPLHCNMFLSLNLSAIKVSLPKPSVRICCSIVCMRHMIVQPQKITELHCGWVLVCGSPAASHSSNDSPKAPGAVCMDLALSQMVKMWQAMLLLPERRL